MTKEEAIRILASSCIPGSKQTEALETLIPELRESEDERIRKQLIDAIKIGRSNSGISFTEEAASRYIAWLEKQKEQKELPLMNDDADLYFDTWRQEVPVPTFRQCFEEGMRYAQRLQKEQKPVNHNFTTFHRDVVYCAMCDKNLDEGLRCNLEIVYKIIKDIVDRTPVVEEQKSADLSDMMVHKEPYIAPIPTPMVADEQKHILKFKVGDKVHLEGDDVNILTITGIEKDRYLTSYGPILFGAEDIWQIVEQKLTATINGEPIPTENYSVNIPLAEWSDDDSDNLERVENYLWMLDDYVGDDCAMPQGKTDKIRENIQEILLPWLKSLPKRFNLQPKQEWSEEDKDTINLMIAILRENYSNCLFKTNSANTIRMSAISTDILIKRIEALCPQPKQEWNEEDERMFSRCVKSIESSKQFADSDTFKKAKDNEIDWLENRIKSFRPVKQEWSEEDEKYLNRVINLWVNDFGEDSDTVKWLKSLRPSWKPSEEQMDKLFSIVAALRKDYCDDMADFLANLYADLKKLGVKEEPEYYQHFDPDC